jgi:hypothetical protein
MQNFLNRWILNELLAEAIQILGKVLWGDYRLTK